MNNYYYIFVFIKFYFIRNLKVIDFISNNQLLNYFIQHLIIITAWIVINFAEQIWLSNKTQVSMKLQVLMPKIT